MNHSATEGIDFARMRLLDKVIVSLRSDNMKRQKALSQLQLLVELAMTLFITGIVVPSLLHFGPAPNGALAGGSLHAINIAGVTFLFTYSNIGVAILGMLVGATVALVIEMKRPICVRLLRVERVVWRERRGYCGR